MLTFLQGFDNFYANVWHLSMAKMSDRSGVRNRWMKRVGNVTKQR
jgi:hypothetical protein